MFESLVGMNEDGNWRIESDALLEQGELTPEALEAMADAEEVEAAELETGE